MTGSPLELLKLLGGAGRAGAGAQRPPASDIGGADFTALLEKAREGGVASGREVSIASDAGVSLDPGQLARLAVAADKAEASGAKKAVVLIDGKAVKLDVGSRTVTGAADIQAAGVMSGIDTVLTAPGGPEQKGGAPAPGPLPYKGGSFNPSLLKILAKSQDAA